MLFSGSQMLGIKGWENKRYLYFRSSGHESIGNWPAGKSHFRPRTDELHDIFTDNGCWECIIPYKKRYLWMHKQHYHKQMDNYISFCVLLAVSGNCCFGSWAGAGRSSEIHCRTEGTTGFLSSASWRSMLLISGFIFISFKPYSISQLN